MNKQELTDALLEKFIAQSEGYGPHQRRYATIAVEMFIQLVEVAEHCETDMRGTLNCLNGACAAAGMNRRASYYLVNKLDEALSNLKGDSK